jgi:Flp pilus assembly protein CpaB
MLMQKTRRRSFIFLGIAILLALIAGGIFFARLNALEREIGERVPVVVAARNIPTRSLITPDMVEMKEVPRKYIEESANYIFSLGDVLDDLTVALVDFTKGDPLLRNALDKNAGLKPNMRAVSISVNRVQSVGGSVRPGNHVDVLVSYTRKQQAETGGEEMVATEEQEITEILFQDVEVIAVSLLSPASTMAMPEGEEEGLGVASAPAPARFLPTGEMLAEATVTLALPLEDAAKLTYMANFGKEVRLVIRRLDEKEAPEVGPVSSDSFSP